MSSPTTLAEKVWNRHVVHAAAGEPDLLYIDPVSYTHLRAHETVLDLVCRLLLEKKKYTNLKYDYKTIHQITGIPHSERCPYHI